MGEVMNKLIQKLALEARLGPALLLHHYGKVDALTDTEREELEQIEKFAELIVRECASLIVGDDPAFILEHFGVEP